MVPVLAARRPTDSFPLEHAIAATPPLPPVAHATRSDPFDVFMGRTFSRTGHSIDTRMVAAGEGRVVRLGVGLAAGPTDDRPFSQAFIKGLAELQTFFDVVFRSRFPGLSFLCYEIRHVSRTTRHAFHWYTAGLVREAAPGSIRISILLDPSIAVHDF